MCNLKWVVREKILGNWVSTYFIDSKKAHKFCRNSLRAGGCSIILRNVR